MKAVFFEKNGGVDVLKYEEIDIPILHKDEALVKVKACSLNRIDLWLRQNKLDIQMPHIPGSDVSGVLERVNGKSIFKPGDEVIINPAIDCGICESCKKKLSCELTGILGFNNQGGYAEYITVPVKQLFLKPKNLTFNEASAFPLTFLTAWHSLITRADLKKGETVYIWGASGGLGTAAIQIARYKKARIIAAVKSYQIGKKLTEIGVDEFINYKEEKVEEKVASLNKNKGVDVVFESVGASTWNTSLNILKPFGRVVIAGTTSGDNGAQDLSDIFVKQFSILGARMGTKDEFNEVLNLIKKNKLRPVIDRVFPLSKAKEAQQRMEEEKHIGKIVLEI